MLFIDYANNAAQYLSFYPLYNFYCITLAIFFLPSNTIEDDAHEVIASSLSFDDDMELGTKMRTTKRRKREKQTPPDMTNVVDIDLGNMEDDTDTANNIIQPYSGSAAVALTITPVQPATSMVVNATTV